MIASEFGSGKAGPQLRPAPPRTIEARSGVQLRDMFGAAAGWLEKHAESVNAINVFPVPDGDTGTNMFLTMRSVMEEAQRCPDEGAGAIMAAMARGAYKAAPKPVEGTILTVMRESAVAARQALDAAAGDVVAVLEATVEEATQSLERTPTLLPVLAEAGVVDAGGKGLPVMLGGPPLHLH